MRHARIQHHGRGLAAPLFLGATILLAAASLDAAPSRRLIAFQAQLTDGSAQPLTGTHRVTFSIYDAPTGGQLLWGETHEEVSVVDGAVNVLLGSVHDLDDANNDGDPSDPVQFDAALGPRFLGIKIGVDANQEMVPRHTLVASFHARTADTTVAGGVGTEQLAEGAVETAQLADQAVTAAKIDDSLLNGQVPPGSIMPYAGSTAPRGWVLCEGQTLDGTDPLYARLFGAIGVTFGGGGTAFKTPDLRGQFLRGRDAGAGVDPDAGSRVGGDAVGSTQGPAIVALSGTVVPSDVGTTANGTHNHRLHADINDQDAFGPTTLAFDAVSRFTTQAAYTYNDGLHSHIFTLPASPVTVRPTGGAGLTSTEVRPKNIAVNYICKL